MGESTKGYRKWEIAALYNLNSLGSRKFRDCKSTVLPVLQDEYWTGYLPLYNSELYKKNIIKVNNFFQHQPKNWYCLWRFVNKLGTMHEPWRGCYGWFDLFLPQLPQVSPQCHTVRKRPVRTKAIYRLTQITSAGERKFPYHHQPTES